MKLVGLVFFAFLAGSSQPIHVFVSPQEVSITVPQSVLEQHSSTPLSKDQFLMRKALQSVPVFETGTSVAAVRDALIDQNLRILVEFDDYMVVREGMPLIDTPGPIREKYIYGFDRGLLVLGPLDYRQVQSHFVSAGLTSEYVEVLRMFADIDPPDPEWLNEFARLLATHPDPAIRNPQVAIQYATRAVSLDETIYWDCVDTLAAAYAAAGDFDNAVTQQRLAIELHDQQDVEADERLRLYQERQSYVAPLSFWTETADESSAAEIIPKAELLNDAAAGSAEAQWRLAVFYLGKNITASQGVMNPGLFWLKKAANNGHHWAINEVGFCYLMALCGVAQNNAEAVWWFRLAAEAGDATGAFNFGRMLANGQGVARDDVVATRWLEVAADGGITAAAFRVAMRHGEGIGKPPNYFKKNKYLEQAAIAGYGPADYLLDDAFFQQFSGAESIAAALDRGAVEPDEMAGALMFLASRIENGTASANGTIIVRFDDNSVIEYADGFGTALFFNLTRIAASLGSSEAQIKFASLFEQGEIAPRSMTEAYYWRQRAAQ